MDTYSDSLLSIEQVAAVLRLHVRTVRNYVRRGTLRATRIGKQYRIARSDLEKLTGRRPETVAETVAGAVRRIEVSSVVSVENVGAPLAGRLTDLLTAIASAHLYPSQPLAAITPYDAQQRRLRVLLAADLETTRDVLRLIAATLEAG